MEKHSGITKETLLNLKEKLKDGVLPQWVLADRDMYDLEIKQIFGKTWQFLAHESELKESGSYVTRWIANDPILLTKTKSGEIKAFLNSCTHRGTLLCTADSGKQKSFTCPFHGWTYNNEGELVGIAVGNKVYGEEMNKEDWNLRPVPKVDIYQGMIFGNLDLNAESLSDYLGNMKWYLDMMLGRSDGGMEVQGSPQRYVVEANWKVTAENFESDPYHVQFTHKSSKELGIAPNDPFFPGHGHQVVLDNGHGINLVQLDDTGVSPIPYQGMPESMWPMFQKNLNKEQNDMVKDTFFVGGVYPNLGFLQFTFPLLDSDNGLYNFLNFRVWRPLAPDKVEVWSWHLIDKDAPQEYKEKSYVSFLSTFGPSGLLEQDDAEIWSRVTQASNGIMAQDKDLSYNSFLNYLMGMDRVQPNEDFPGPGVAYPLCFLDTLSRSMHKRWIDLLLAETYVKEEVR
jgi:phenylpropionate dioxygenase-like ring-hydroxylating dioxygenase large terminal subunit